MSVEEDDASLKELVSKTLQTNGVLGKIQAQLRASVFLALEEEFKDKNIPLVSASAKQLLATPEGVLAAALVHNFLQCLSLDFSLAVFAPESGHSTLWTFPGEDALSSNLNLSNKQAGDKAPLLIELLKERTSSKPSELGHNRDKGVSKGRLNDMGHLPQLSAPRTLQPISNIPLSNSHFGGNSQVLKNQRETNFLDFSSAKEDKMISNIKNESQKSDEIGENKDPLATQIQERNNLGSLTLGMDTAPSKNDDDKARTGTGTNIHGKKETLEVKAEGTKQEAGDSLTGLEKQYEDDFSSMSEKGGQDDGEEDDVEEEEEEEEIEDAEDIDEDISLDDLMNSSASINSEHTKDQSLSQASDAPNYQEDL
ncbi:centrosomal protein 43-like isoform X1 [Penaeus chinensis]|uniref:centrosomal protein 43-like isoform X1 n=1 Tax=Penaeus chinensis TaxID=139456 RepID=UPI001FB82601|nr:centrosomal protein 43-like isoform X1 [Penaeus chinensis]